jgi:hypothetical protein
VRENTKSFEIFRIYICYKMESSKLIKYLSNMCGSYPCIRVVNFDEFFGVIVNDLTNDFASYGFFVCMCVCVCVFGVLSIN